jgi:hypothetical protein
MIPIEYIYLPSVVVIGVSAVVGLIAVCLSECQQ